MRNRFAETFYEIAQKDPRQCLIVADISPAGSIQKFREAYPDRFINTGVAEQVMIGMAAGMSMAGLRPWAYTIATFALYRPFEMVRNDLAYQKLPVTVVGIGGGVAYSTLGATHHAMEDIAVASAIPGLSIIAPSDPDETEEATRYCAAQEQGPVYLRLGKAGEPSLTSDAVDKWAFGRLRKIRNGSTICLLTYGTILKKVLEVADEMKRRGDSPAVYECHTLRPLDIYGLTLMLQNYRRVVVIEEMVVSFGLGVRVQALAHRGQFPAKVSCYGLQSEFKHVYGSHDDLLAAHGLTVHQIAGGLANYGE